MRLDHLDYFQKILKDNTGIHVNDMQLDILEEALYDLMNYQKIDTVFNLIKRFESNLEEQINLLLIFINQDNIRFVNHSELLTAYVSKVLPELNCKYVGQEILIWFMPVSMGHGVYRLMMEIDNNDQTLLDSVKIFATDLSSKYVNFANHGVYPESDLRKGLALNFITKYFEEYENNWRIVESLRDRINFFKFSPSTDRMRKDYYHTIFCLDYLKYQTSESKKIFLENIYNSLRPGGYLIIGEGESIIGLETNFKRKKIGNITCYIKD